MNSVDAPSVADALIIPEVWKRYDRLLSEYYAALFLDDELAFSLKQRSK